MAALATLTGAANGVIAAYWTVPVDGNPNNATLNVTAVSAGADGEFGTSDDALATTTFTDSAGSYTIKWYAADPAVNSAPFLQHAMTSSHRPNIWPISAPTRLVAPRIRSPTPKPTRHLPAPVIAMRSHRLLRRIWRLARSCLSSSRLW